MEHDILSQVWDKGFTAWMETDDGCPFLQLPSIGAVHEKVDISDSRQQHETSAFG